MLVEESRWLIEENRRLAEENKQLKARLDEALNAIAFQAEEIRRLKDEIARLKGQKSRPKIPPSALEGAQSMDKQSDKNRVSRGKHPRRKKTHKRYMPGFASSPKPFQKELSSRDAKGLPCKISFFNLTTRSMSLSDGGCPTARTLLAKCRGISRATMAHA